MAGSGWACATTTCIRSDALNGGSSYPTITVIVNVAPDASSPQLNQVSVSGGGSTGGSATDSTTITAVIAGGSSTNYVTSFSLGTARNNFSGWVGISVTVGNTQFER